MENNNQEIKKNDSLEEPVKGFFSRLMTGVIDQCIVIGSSLIALLIMDGVVRLLGYYIAERVPIFFLLYVLANIIYPLIMQGTRFRATFGNRLFR